jgi:hypothetical protein
MEKCKLCQDDVMDTRFGVCFDCASAQEIIGEQILKEEKPIKTNAILKGLAEKGYVICEKKFVERARKAGIERDEL